VCFVIAINMLNIPHTAGETHQVLPDQTRQRVAYTRSPVHESSVRYVVGSLLQCWFQAWDLCAQHIEQRISSSSSSSFIVTMCMQDALVVNVCKCGFQTPGWSRVGEVRGLVTYARAVHHLDAEYSGMLQLRWHRKAAAKFITLFAGWRRAVVVLFSLACMINACLDCVTLQHDLHVLKCNMLPDTKSTPTTIYGT